MGVTGLVLATLTLASMRSPVLAEAPAEAEQRTIDVRGLADGPYSRMQGMLRKTVFRVGVLRVGVRVDSATQKKLESIAAGRPYSDARGHQVAQVMLQADDVLIVAEFQRSVSYERFLQNVQRDLRRALDANLITESDYREVSRLLPGWFRPIAQRGIQDGDLLVYRVRPETLQTVFVTKDGAVVIDQIDEGRAPRKTFLASYFATETSLRTLLIRSLFR